MKLSVFWFRRDLRLVDNIALSNALKSGLEVLPVFIFDKNILGDLSDDDPRINFIYYTLEKINDELISKGSSVKIYISDPIEAWKNILTEFDVNQVFFNKDYEPYARKRDIAVKTFLHKNNISVREYKDQVIFEEDEVAKDDGKTYTVFTPYKKKWLYNYSISGMNDVIKNDYGKLYKNSFPFPALEEIGFRKARLKVKDYDLSKLDIYAETRDFPAKDTTTYLGPHLRFGTVSIRDLFRKLYPEYDVFLSELIWREFFMQIIYHYPHVVTRNFNNKYDDIRWINNEDDFEKWCEGKTGYPMVDAGMRQLNETGFMHNRVRMITAGFLCKHLLIDWRWGEAYFAKNLLDYELSSNNGNWQWAAGTGCDAAPYFRVFNPETQLKKFDKESKYIKKWLPELGTSDYPKPVIEHSFARTRAINTYKEGIKTS